MCPHRNLDSEVYKTDSEEPDKETVKSRRTLNQVRKVFSRWLKFTDWDRLDLMLAVASSRKTQGSPLWLIIVGPSGDGKTELMRAFKGPGSYWLMSITSKTLTTNFKGAEDLAPKLHKKLVLIPEFAEILNMHPHAKAEVLAQLRNLYDGYAGSETGVGTKFHKDLQVTLMACSTTAIDSQKLHATQLGTRELYYRTPGEDVKILDIMHSTFNEDEMRSDLFVAVCNFLASIEQRTLSGIKDDFMAELEKMGQWLVIMRASAQHDSSDGSLVADVVPEVPARLFKQLYKLFMALMSLDPKYKAKDAYRIMWKVVRSSALMARTKVLQAMKEQGDNIWTAGNYRKATGLGKKTVFRELWTFANLGFLEWNTDDMVDSWRQRYDWSVTKKGRSFLALDGKSGSTGAVTTLRG